MWRNVIVFLHNLSIYVPICIYAGFPSPGRRCSSFPGLLFLCLDGLWIAVLLGAVCARYRDVQQLVGNVLQIALFLTPIFWSADQLTGRATILADYNPLHHLIAIVREPMMGKAPDTLHWVVVRWDAARLVVDRSRDGQVSPSHCLLALAPRNRTLAQITLDNVVTEFPIYGAQPTLRSGAVRPRRRSPAARQQRRGKRVVVRALDQRVAHVNHGDQLGILGHNGAGKSTMLRVLAGIYRAEPRLDQY